MDITIFCINTSDYYLPTEDKEKVKSKDLDRTMSSTFQSCSGERVCVSLFSWLAVSLLPGNIMRL